MSRRLSWQRELARYQRNAATAATRLAAAREAYQEGKTRVAGRLLRVLATRRRTPQNYRSAARQALGQIHREAVARMEALEDELVLIETGPPPSANDRFSAALRVVEAATQSYAGVETVSASSSARSQVRSLFEQMDQLVWDHETLPETRRELGARVTRLRREARYAAMLNEPEALRLVQQARLHERDDQSCCAFLLYKQASRLRHAPSAQLAARRLADMNQDEQMADSVRRCKQLRKCHETYQVAELLAGAGHAQRARRSFEQVVAEAPADSEIRAAALNRIAALDRSDG